jgi:CRISPR-associated protein Csm1
MKNSSLKYTNEELATVALACILHDIGKPIQRASLNPTQKNHQRFGYDFFDSIQKNLSIQTNNFEWRSILQSIRYHHAKEGPSNALDTYVPWIAYEADNLASAHDRHTAKFLYEDDNRLDECDDSVKSKWDANRRLQSIFTYFHKSKKEQFEFDLWLKADKERRLDPYPYPKLNLTTPVLEQYQKIQYKIETLSKFISQYEKIDTDLLNIVSHQLEELLSYIPPDTYKDHTNDVSLYEHLKLTAAIGSCMFAYIREAYPTWTENYSIKPGCDSPWSNIYKSFRQEKAYILFKADISGIQDFIYNISSKQALKNLRGRSFYLELLCQQISDEILKFFKLGRINQIYLGGGGFSLLLPNVSSFKESIEMIENNINSWLLKLHDGKLSISFGYKELSGNEIKMRSQDVGKENHPLNNAWQSVSLMIGEKKICKFQNNLHEVFNTASKYIDECQLCHKETHLTQSLSEYNDKKICNECKSLIEYGAFLADAGNCYFEFQQSSNGLFPELNENLSISSLDLKKTEYKTKNSFVVNDFHQEIYPKIFWSSSVAQEKNQTSDFETLASKSMGVKRIGVLRADVDNLGKVFKSEDKYGFIPEFKSLSRDTSLSRNLARFFTLYLDDLLKDENLSSAITVVYSGGDDLFLVGAWNKVIDTALLINSKFSEYCLNSLTISAGISIHGPKFPLYRMAEAAGSAEKVAKINNKNSLCVYFDNGVFRNQNPSHTFNWNTWNNIKKEINLLTSLDLSSAYLYQILIYIRELLESGKSYTFPRLIYTTARMEDQNSNLKNNVDWLNFRDKLFEYFETQNSSSEELRKLETILNYLLLLNRGANDATK